MGGVTGVQMPSFGIYNLALTSTVHYGSNEGQTITDIPFPGYGNLVLSGIGNKAPSFSLDIQGDFILQSATFWPWDMTHTIKGNWIRNGGTFNYDGGRMVFAGTTPQTIGGSQPTTFYNVTFANTSGITLLQPTSVFRNATFTSGVVNSNAANPLIFNDEATSSLLAANAATTSYVNGPVKKIGNNAFIFPIGAATGFVPLAISAPDNDADAFTAQYIRGAPAERGDITAPGIDHISSSDYWDLTEFADAGTPTTINVTLYWNGNNPFAGMNGYVTDPTKIKAVHYTGGSWSEASIGFGTGTGASGSVIFAGLSTFSPFALASTTAGENPLPVVFADVKAYEKGDGVQIEWSNLTEKDVAEYTIERSTNGRDFSPLTKQLPSSNQDEKVSYVAFDAVPHAGANFYRIKAEETTGKIVYSKILSVKLDNTDSGLKLYPNPASGNQITINLSNVKNGKYNLTRSECGRTGYIQTSDQ